MSASEDSAGRSGLTGASSRLVRARFTLLLPAIPLPLVVIVVAGVVLRVVLPGGLALLGTRVRLRTFALFGGGSAHHGLNVPAQGELLLLLHEGDAHRRGVRDGRLVVLLA